MYDLVDRPVVRLGSFERRMLDATRRWVHALSVAGVDRAATDDPFDRAMRLLDEGSTDDLVVQRPCHDSVNETEAVLLGLWRLVREGRDAAARGAAALIVDLPRAERLVGAMQRTVHA